MNNSDCEKKTCLLCINKQLQKKIIFFSGVQWKMLVRCWWVWELIIDPYMQKILKHHFYNNQQNSIVYDGSFFIFTYFNRKFRRELARVCFHTKKKRSTIINNTSSHPSFRRTSYIRTPQANSQNLQQMDVGIMKIIKVNYEKAISFLLIKRIFY